MQMIKFCYLLNTSFEYVQTYQAMPLFLSEIKLKFTGTFYNK